MTKVIYFSLVTFLLACNTLPNDDSTQKDVGGPTFTHWSCNLTKYEFTKFFPLYLHHYDEFKHSCLKETDKILESPHYAHGENNFLLTNQNTPNNFFASQKHIDVLDNCVAKHNGNFSACIQNIDIPTLPNFQPDRDEASNYCRGLFINMGDYRRRISKAVYRWRGVGKFAGDPCDDGQIESYSEKNTKIYDFPSCDIGCLGGTNHDCSYCKWKHEEKRAGESDNNGAIACNTELSARKGVKEWCIFYGIENQCDLKEDVSCQSYNKTLKETLAKNNDYAGLTGNPTPTGIISRDFKHSAAYSFSVSGRAKGKIPFGPAAGSELTYKFTSDANYSVTITSENVASLFDEGGLGAKNAKFTCSVTASNIKATSLSGHLDFVVLGNGVSTGSTAAGGTIETLTGKSNNIGAAGQTLEQIKSRCHHWGQSYMKSQVDGSFLVSAALQLGKYQKARSREIRDPNVQCLYNRSWNKPFKPENRREHVITLSAVSFNFNQDGVNIWVVPKKGLKNHSIEAWSTLASANFTYEQLTPWLKKIYDNKMDAWETANLLNQLWVPATNNNKKYAVSSNGALHKCWEIQYYPYTDPLKD